MWPSERFKEPSYGAMVVVTENHSHGFARQILLCSSFPSLENKLLKQRDR